MGKEVSQGNGIQEGALPSLPVAPQTGKWSRNTGQASREEGPGRDDQLSHPGGRARAPRLYSVLHTGAGSLGS